MKRDTEARPGGDRPGGEDLEFLRDHLARLPRRIEPRRDLWPGIEREIRSAPVVPGPFRRWRREILALAAVLTVFAAALATGLRRPGPEAEVAVAPGEAAVPDAVPAASAGETRELLARLAGEGVDPSTVEVIRQNLEIIDGAVEEIRRALEADPGSLALNHRLAAETQRRGALLRRAARLAEPI